MIKELDMLERTNILIYSWNPVSPSSYTHCLALFKIFNDYMYLSAACIDFNIEYQYLYRYVTYITVDYKINFFCLTY